MPAKIDPKSGLPVELVKEGRKQARLNELEQGAKKGLQIRTALKSDTGKLFERHCKEVLENEIREFVSKDPKCQAIVQILRSIGVEIKEAEYAIKILEEQLRQ